MAGKADKAAAAMKNGGQKAKTAAAKVYALATDPEVQAKTAKIVADGRELYRAITSPEAREAYRQAARVVDKMRKK